ncbi:MAG: ShlB/FhaC/HecB family hemolysin secretion/activation protein [Cyclobacteriaceae bacterium]
MKEVAGGEPQVHSATTVILRDLWKKNYLFAQVVQQSDSLTQIYRGDLHPFFIRSIHSTDSSYIDADPGGKKSALDKIESLQKQWANSGYPFARFSLHDIRPETKGYSTRLIIDRGPYISFDTLFLLSKVKTDPAYIEKALGLPRGESYSEERFRSVGASMARLPYLSLKSVPDISFENEEATIYLDLEEKSTNSFEGVVGVLPGQNEGKVLITGYFDLELNNLFRTGKSFGLEWNRFASQSQSIEVGYDHPFFLETRLLFGVDFSLFKQDTSFVNQALILSFGTYLGSKGSFKGTYQRSNANLISTDEQLLRNQNLVDYSRDIYGVNFEINNYKIPFGFSEGWKLNASAAAGTKKIRRNPALDEHFYDTLALRSNLFKVDFHFKYQKFIARQLAFNHRFESGYIHNDQILNNEMYRLGGLNSVRGFNENFFFAQEYFINRLELRQYFESDSYFMLLFDQLYYQNRDDLDTPIAFGLGLVLSANNSLFNFAMAVGKSSDIPLDLSAAKIHFGFTSRF